MKQLQWNYIAIMYDNDIYGTEAKNNFANKAVTHSICVAKVFALDVNEIKLSKVQDNIQDIVGNNESPINGIVVFARGDNVNTVVRIASDFNDPLSFIFSEAIGLSDSFFKKEARFIYVAAKGSFVVSPAAIRIEEFEDHWRELMQNVSVLLEESKANSFLSKVYETYSGCLPTTSNVCPALRSKENITLDCLCH